MVREPDATMLTAPQDIQLMSKHCVLSFKPQLRLERQGQDGQNEMKQPDHSASLGDSITSSTRIRFSVHARTCADSLACQRISTASGRGRTLLGASRRVRSTANRARSRSFRNAPCAALLNKVDLLGTPLSMLLEDSCSPNFAASTSALTSEGVRPTFSKLAAVILRRGL
jgi:hypothetical protein